MSVLRVVFFLFLLLMTSKSVQAIGPERPVDDSFLKQAKQLMNDGDYNTARDLCEEYLKRSPGSIEGMDLLNKSRTRLKKLAEEAYHHGIELEYMNNLSAAKQYWQRAKVYLRPGDEFYEVVKIKLEKYND